MTKDEALKLALDALELVNIEFVCNGAHHAKKDRHEFSEDCPITKRYREAITAIKEALMSVPDGSQPEHGWTPERIAGMARLKEAQDKKLAQPEQDVGIIRYAEISVGKIIHNSPPPQRKPLTDEKFRSILASLSRQQGWDGDGWDLALKEAIEAAHGITEEKNT